MTSNVKYSLRFTFPSYLSSCGWHLRTAGQSRDRAHPRYTRFNRENPFQSIQTILRGLSSQYNSRVSLINRKVVHTCLGIILERPAYGRGGLEIQLKNV